MNVYISTSIVFQYKQGTKMIDHMPSMFENRRFNQPENHVSDNTHIYGVIAEKYIKASEKTIPPLPTVRLNDVVGT